MARTCSAMLLSGLLLMAAAANAGNGCQQQEVAPHKLEAAARTALLAAAALDEVDAPVALIARVGTDLSKQGLVYSHAGFVVRDHAHGRWTVVHLLNECGSDRSGLYAQGLVNFFSDDLVNQDLRIVWFKPHAAERLSERLKQMPRHSLHHPRYNLIARPGSGDYQNSTAWLVEMMASALADRAVYDRATAYAFARSDGFLPDTIHIPYSRRVLGGLLSANADFTDHPVVTRLSGDYPVITVRSIFRYLDRAGYVERQEEWRGGKRQAQPGPA
ncbi:hypothetical protein SAMN06296416_102418 [Pseudoxanthomonas wuyuanensis]|nr:DUF2145 domain-containing protein [Pseudoxanthomonas wuyuanensis]SOD53453.1 hypothetical protein SAMN06296416_102418 [Pseudoxanthomonas wuyuanensis]